jgi:hypothetical protein
MYLGQPRHKKHVRHSARTFLQLGVPLIQCPPALPAVTYLFAAPYTPDSPLYCRRNRRIFIATRAPHRIPLF